MNQFKRLAAIVRQYGTARPSYRAGYELLRRIGVQRRRFPAWRWEERPLASWLTPGLRDGSSKLRQRRNAAAPRFLFSPGRPPEPLAPTQSLLLEADAIRAGRFRYFFRSTAPLGDPLPDWKLNPFTGQRDDSEQHWSKGSDFEAARGDIKFIWEPSRFAWVYTLIRAYAATGEGHYVEHFWRLFESWLHVNPPNRGVNWRCGQETAIRAMACLFAHFAFERDEFTTDTRWEKMLVFLAGSAERIAGNINYARVQMGNHATSEAAAIYAIGLLFPEFRDAHAWMEKGRFVLEDEIRKFNYDDGAYFQHSMIYQRLMLHSYILSVRLAELNGHSFSEFLLDRLARSLHFLYQLQDPETYRVPNYGPNDGSVMFPVTSCDYLDFRPLLGNLHRLLHGGRLYAPGDWEEESRWFFGNEPESPRRPLSLRTSHSFLSGGYHVLRGDRTWGFIRCHSYRNRPNQADSLHADLWWRGVNFAADGGTYSYFDPDERWDRYFVSTAAHNTVRVGGCDQMVKGPRFQWYSLLNATFRGLHRGELTEVWEGEHDGYRRLRSKAIHRRALARIGERFWLVVDDILGHGKELLELQWRLDGSFRGGGHPGEFTLSTRVGDISLRLVVPANGSAACYPADRENPRTGWRSLYYGEKEALPCVRGTVDSVLPARMISLFALGERIELVRVQEYELSWCTAGGDDKIRLSLRPPGDEGSVIASVRDGKREERITLRRPRGPVVDWTK